MQATQPLPNQFPKLDDYIGLGYNFVHPFTTLSIHNLKSTVTSEEIKEILQSHAKVKDVTVAPSGAFSKKGKNKVNLAMVEFETSEETTKAYKAILSENLMSELRDSDVDQSNMPFMAFSLSPSLLSKPNLMASPPFLGSLQPGSIIPFGQNFPAGFCQTQFVAGGTTTGQIPPTLKIPFNPPGPFQPLPQNYPFPKSNNDQSITPGPQTTNVIGSMPTNFSYTDLKAMVNSLPPSPYRTKAEGMLQPHPFMGVYPPNTQPLMMQPPISPFAFPPPPDSKGLFPTPGDISTSAAYQALVNMSKRSESNPQNVSSAPKYHPFLTDASSSKEKISIQDQNVTSFAEVRADKGKKKKQPKQKTKENQRNLIFEKVKAIVGNKEDSWTITESLTNHKDHSIDEVFSLLSSPQDFKKLVEDELSLVSRMNGLEGM